MDFWDQGPSLSRACCVGPDPYRPIVQFQFIGRILWQKFYVPEVWTRSTLLPKSSDLFAAAATNRRSSRSGEIYERRSDSNPPPCQSGGEHKPNALPTELSGRTTELSGRNKTCSGVFLFNFACNDVSYYI